MISTIHGADDDWRGITSPAERRKRQNRLNQRARRQREQCREELARTTNGAVPDFKFDKEPWGTSSSTMVVAVRNRRHAPGDGYRALLATHSGERHTVVELIQRYFSNHATTILHAPSNARNLALLNLLVAVSTNANTLGISWHYLEQQDSVSRFNCLGPNPMNAPGLILENNLPVALRPTQLQRNAVHHPWIDLIPFAVMRNSIITALATGSIDKDELCESMFIMDPGEGALSPVAIWGPAEDVGSWEFSPTFFARWADLTSGCPEMLEITNQWRQKRGQRRLKLLPA